MVDYKSQGVGTLNYDIAPQQTQPHVRLVGIVLKNSEAKNKTFTRALYFFISRANVGSMSLSNAKFLVIRT